MLDDDPYRTQDRVVDLRRRNAALERENASLRSENDALIERWWSSHVRDEGIAADAAKVVVYLVIIAAMTILWYMRSFAECGILVIAVITARFAARVCHRDGGGDGRNC